MSEASERYRVSIFDGASEVRQIEATSNDYLYASVDISADFGGGGPGSTLTFAVAQISDAAGEGPEKKDSVAII